MACEGPRATAEGCTGACGECFPDGFQGFVDSVDGAFKKTQAFVMTTDPAYCSIASQNIDDEINLNYECCLDTCGGEMEEYVSCTFNTELAVAFGLVGCERTPPGGGGGGGDGEGGIPMLYVIVGVVVLLLVCCCCCCGCYYRRRKINAAKKDGGGVNVNIDLKSETKNVTDSTTQQQNQQSPPPGGANSQNSKAETVQTMSDTWDNPAFDVERPPPMQHQHQHQQPPPMYPPPGPHGSQRDLYGGMDDWSRMEDTVPPPARGPPQRVSSRRSLRDIMDDDDDMGMDRYNDQDDYGRSTRSRRKGRSLDRSTRSRSNRSLRSYDDDEDYDDDRDSRSGRRSRSKSRRTRKKDKKKHRSASRSRSLSSDTSSSSGSGTASRSRGKKKRAKEIEKARKLIEEHENTKRSKKKLDKEEKASAKAEIKTMLDQLKKDRDAMEEKMKKAEEEAKKLKLERVNSAKSLLELEMAEETNGGGMNSSGHMRRSAKKDAVKAELEAARQEREEMLALINQLEGAQMTMMQQSQHLRNFGMDDFDDDNKSMGVGSVFGLGAGAGGGAANATDELHRQLEETEEMTRNLKYEKKLKKLEIEQLKIMSNGQMTPDIDQAERDRREITKKLKRAQEQTASLHTQILRSQSQAMAQSQQPTFDPLLGSSRAELGGGLGGGSGHQRRRGSGHGLTQDQPNMNMGMGMMRTNSSNQLMGNSSFGNLMAAAGPGGGGMGMGMIPGMDAGGFNPPMQNQLQQQQYGGAEGGYGMEVGYPNQQQLGPMAGMMIDSSTGLCIADDITMDEQLKDSAGTSSHDRKSRKKSKRDKKHSHSSSSSPTSPIREMEPSKPKEQDNRPSGWLGETIRRNSVKDLADLMGDDDDDDYGDGGGRSTSYEPLGQSHRGGRSHNQLDPGGSSHGRSSKKKGMSSSSHHRRSGSRDRNDDGIGGSSRHRRSHSKGRSSSRDTTSTHSRSGGSGDGSGKRDRARRAEKKLRDEMKRSRSSRSTRSFDPDSSMDSGDGFY